MLRLPALGLLALALVPGASAQTGLGSALPDPDGGAPAAEALAASPAAPSRRLPRPGRRARTTLQPGQPDAYAVDARAGEPLWVRVRAEGGVTPVVCLLSADAWARLQSPAAPTLGAPPADPACDRSVNWFTRESAVFEVIPASGAYVVLVTSPDPSAGGGYRIERVRTGRSVPRLPDGRPVAARLGDADAWEVHLGTPVGTHFTAGTAGEQLAVTVEAEGFLPYVEVGTWYGTGYAPLLGSGGGGASTTTRFTVPADGVLTVRVSPITRGGLGPYTVRIDRQPAADWALRFPGGGDPDERYALIASVSDYPGLGTDDRQPDLVGPAADGAAMRDLLVETYGFRPENVVVLRDADVTREAVIEGFRRHLAQAGPGGAAVFHYAGHGTQLPAEAVPGNEPEPDGIDEVLSLWGRGGEVAPLLDYELGALVAELGAGSTLAVLDNCFSGTGLRGETGGAVRSLPYADVADRLAIPERLLVGGGVPSLERAVLLAASQSDQISMELEGFAPDGGVGGVFTGSLVRALRGAPPDATFESVIEAMRPGMEAATRLDMRREGYGPQRPQAEGGRAGARVRDVLGRR